MKPDLTTAGEEAERCSKSSPQENRWCAGGQPEEAILRGI